jgi:hypothetical protein
MLVPSLLTADEIFLDGFELCRTADVIEWDGGGDGTSWSDPANWVGDAVPADGAKVAIREDTSLTVDIGAGFATTLTCLAVTSNLRISWGTLVFDGPATIIGNLDFVRGAMTINGQMIVRGAFDQQPLASVDGPGTLTVGGLFTWTGNNQLGQGATIANGGIEISGSNSKLLRERVMTLNGPGLWTGANIALQSGATINVNAPFEIATDSDMLSTFGAVSSLNISSTLTKSAGTGLTIIDNLFTNGGKINVESGQLEIGYGNAVSSNISSGDFNVAAGSTLSIAGSHIFAAASSISGAGDFVYKSGTGVFEGSLPLTGTWTLSFGRAEFPSGASFLADVEITTGSNTAFVVDGPVNIAGTLLQEPATAVEGVGTLTIAGLFTWTGGSQFGQGETIANGGLQLSGTNTKGLRERTLTLNGASQWTGSGNLDARAGATIEVNAPFDIATDADITHIQFADPVMDIADSLRKTAGAAVTQIAMVVTNSGSVAVESGSLQFLKTYSQDASGSLAVGIAGDADFDAYAVTGAATLGGTLDISLLNAYEPALGLSFEILTASSVSGTFDTVNGTSIVTGKRFDVIYGANNVTLTVVAD